MNGIFSGINKLWRKSKEMFVINRLIAQLINELYRGIILFCFDNNINLTDGTEDTPIDEVVGEDDDEYDIDLDDGFEDDTPESDLESDFDIEDEEIEGEEIEDDLSKYSRDELLKMIKSLTDGINEDSKKITDKQGQINLDSHMLNANHYTIKEKADKNKLINRLKKEAKFLGIELEKSKQQLIRLKDALEKLDSGVNKSTIFDTLKTACYNKYSFNPKMEHLPTEPPEFVDIGSMSLTTFTENLSTIKYNSEYIKIGQEFTVVDNGKLLQIKVWNVDNSTNEVFYYHNGELKGVKVVKLLPKYFPKFKKPSKLCYDFLDKYVSQYDDMEEEEKEKMETIYMQYKVIEEISKVRRVSMIQESINDVDIILESLVKVKAEDSKAGDVSIGRDVAIKTGLSSVNVGDILTKRDKEKYVEKSDKFKLNISKINLAQIEKKVNGLEKTDTDTKSKVSSYVNPYNLKTIQISAEQLMEKNKDDKNLKLKWDKELAKTYAAFNDIMNIQNVDISNGNFGSSISTSSKVVKGSDKMTKDINTQVENGKIMEKLPLEYDSSSYNKMSTGVFTYYAFTYPGNSKLYNTSISPVSSIFKEFGLVCVTSCFSDFKDNKVIDDPQFNSSFISTKSDEASSNNVNVYFLFKKDQRFPSRNTPRPTKIFVLNEYIISGKSYLSMKKVSPGSKNTGINKSSVSNLNKTQYIFNISSVSLYKFISNEITPIASEFNLVRTKDTDENKEYIKKLSEML